MIHSGVHISCRRRQFIELWIEICEEEERKGIALGKSLSFSSVYPMPSQVGTFVDATFPESQHGA